MEENKKKSENSVEDVKEVKKEAKKLSYADLEMTTRQLSAQFDAVLKENMRLKQALQQAQAANVFAQLEFMFKVVENANAFDGEFVQKCIDAIQNIMTNNPEEQPEENTDEQE